MFVFIAQEITLVPSANKGTLLFHQVWNKQAMWAISNGKTTPIQTPAIPVGEIILTSHGITIKEQLDLQILPNPKRSFHLRRCSCHICKGLN